MERIGVDLPGREYEILVGASLTEAVAAGAAALEGCRRAALVSHPALERLHGASWESLEEALRERGIALHRVLFQAGERHKNLDTVRKVYRRLLALGLERTDAVIAWGGGVVGDLAGFAAASYMRGLRYLQVPTTLMAMVDSAIGGKVGVDLPEGKNLVGFFHQPSGVFCDIALLATLPEREYLSGLAEMAKYGLVFDATLCERMRGARQGLRAGRKEDLVPAVAACAAVKARVTVEDERDLAGRRALLNYGHTFAHALEAATSYRTLLHGEAVALGMRMAAALSEGLGLAEPGLYREHLDLLAGLGVSGGERLGRGAAGLQEAVLRGMAHDKKNRGGELRLVLLKGIADPLVLKRRPDRDVAAAVRAVLEEEAGAARKGGGRG